MDIGYFVIFLVFTQVCNSYVFNAIFMPAFCANNMSIPWMLFSRIIHVKSMSCNTHTFFTTFPKSWYLRGIRVKFMHINILRKRHEVDTHVFHTKSMWYTQHEHHMHLSWTFHETHMHTVCTKYTHHLIGVGADISICTHTYKLLSKLHFTTATW